ncbi:MAG: DUF4114 domain-containing protein [Scytonematopsis contorta HA4267-MV1]|jgi:hypothetical protein|nr:DUF4114 domain-containing protein [Scytonematopsis contorta HA4267-MV1]
MLGFSESAGNFRELNFNSNSNNFSGSDSFNLLSAKASGLNNSLPGVTAFTSSSSNPSIEPRDAGVFTVGDTGKVSFDYLFDGGGYRGELGIFNLEGMSQYEIGSKEFIQEAAIRALRNDSNSGYVVMDDPSEGAKITGATTYERDLNTGNYLGKKTFSLSSGSQFGIMLVPNGTIQEASSNPDLIADNRPLFSISAANPQQTTQLAQLVNFTSDSQNETKGITFSFEDMQLNRNADRDYNDLIFKIEGATGVATVIDKVINPKRDWRQSTIGQQVIQNAVEPEDLAGSTVDKARIVNFTSGSSSYQGWVGSGDTADYYSFSLDKSGDLKLSLDGLSSNGDVKLLNADGNVIFISQNSGVTAESINTTLKAGTYNILITPSNNESTAYNLELSFTGN